MKVKVFFDLDCLRKVRKKARIFFVPVVLSYEQKLVSVNS